MTFKRRKTIRGEGGLPPDPFGALFRVTMFDRKKI